MGNSFSCNDAYDTYDEGKIVCDHTMNEFSLQLKNNISTLIPKLFNNCNYQSCLTSTKHVKDDCLQKYSVHCSSPMSLYQQPIKVKRCVSQQKNNDICTCLFSEYKTNAIRSAQQKEIKKESESIHMNLTDQSPYDLQCLCYTVNSSITHTQTDPAFSETESTNFTCPHIVKRICTNGIPNEHNKNDSSFPLLEIINTILQFDSNALKVNNTLSSDKKPILKEDQFKSLQEKTNSFTVSPSSNTPKYLSKFILEMNTNTSSQTKHTHLENKSEQFEIEENNTSAFADNAVGHVMYMRNFDGRKMVLSNGNEISTKNSFVCCDWNESAITMLLASVFVIATVLLFYTQYTGFKKKREIKKSKRIERENAVMEMLLKQFDDYPKDSIEEVNENIYENQEDGSDADEEDYEEENTDDSKSNKESNII